MQGNWTVTIIHRPVRARVRTILEHILNINTKEKYEAFYSNLPQSLESTTKAQAIRQFILLNEAGVNVLLLQGSDVRLVVNLGNGKTSGSLCSGFVCYMLNTGNWSDTIQCRFVNTEAWFPLAYIKEQLDQYDLTEERTLNSKHPFGHKVSEYERAMVADNEPIKSEPIKIESSTSEKPSAPTPRPNNTKKVKNSLDLPAKEQAPYLYADLVHRAIAFAIDIITVLVAIFLVELILTKLALPYVIAKSPIKMSITEMTDLYYAFLMVITVAIFVAYFVGFESSEWQATPGKKALGLIVTGKKGEPMSVLQSFIRHVGKSLTMATYGIGFIVAGFTQRKQAMHDIIAETYVLRQNGLERWLSDTAPTEIKKVGITE